MNTNWKHAIDIAKPGTDQVVETRSSDGRVTHVRVLSKRERRILAAKVRPKVETDRLRKSERAVRPSEFRKFIVSWDKRTMRELARKRGGK